MSDKKYIVFTLTIGGILSTILFFYFSNQLVAAKSKLNVQAVNMTLFLSGHNLIITNPHSFPESFLQSSYRYYLLASEGREPTESESMKIHTKDDYVSLTEGDGVISKVNQAKNTLEKEGGKFTDLYNLTFVLSVLFQFSAALLSLLNKDSVKANKILKQSLIGLIVLVIILFSGLFTIELLRIDWVAISGIVLAGTAYLIYKQTKATEELAEYQVLPVVEVCIKFDQTKKGNSFRFINYSKMPAYVFLSAITEKGESTIHTGPFRVPAQKETIGTSPDYDLGFSESFEPNRFVLKVKIKPAIENSNAEYSYEKKYTFRNGDWDEDTWGWSDSRMFKQANLNIKNE